MKALFPAVSPALGASLDKWQQAKQSLEVYEHSILSLSLKAQ